MLVSSKLAPFGEYLARTVIQNNYEIALIFMGTHSHRRAADFQQHLPCTLYLPNGESPYRYHWPIQGCDVYLIDTSNAQPSFIHTCVKCFLANGANQIRYISRINTMNFQRS